VSGVLIECNHELGDYTQTSASPGAFTFDGTEAPVGFSRNS
jgi:hypothetical protein